MADVKGRADGKRDQARTRLARAELTRDRERGQGLLARSLASGGALRPPLQADDAADLIHALMSPEVYGLLVGDRGWPPDRYERWLTAILIGQLLPPAA